ncbi:MAG: M14 family metallopeptidase [Phycisphaerales bacterium]
MHLRRMAIGLIATTTTLIASTTTGLAAEPRPELQPEDGVLVRYDGEKVVRVQIRTKADFDLLNELSDDMWSHHAEVGHPADFRVSAEALERLDAAGVPYTVLIDDLQALVEAERARLLDRPGVGADGTFFDDYRTLDEVSDYVDTLVGLRPDLVERIEVGTSLRGRSIFGMRITSGTPGDRPAVLIHGCQHAREWITVMVNMYLADQFVRAYGTDPTITDLIDSVEFIVIPVVNPDGYEYTWTDNRMWRKNRRSWYGVDLNRNWDYGWGGPGSSGFRFSETYRGAAPFSEPETAALRDFFIANPHIAAHIDFHSYSQLILYPWGYTDDLSPAHDFFDLISARMAEAIEAVHGEEYIYGPSYSTIYPASGVSDDWTYGDQGVLGLAYELRDTGRYGFILPPDQIIPNGEEILPAMVELGQFVAEPSPPLGLEASDFVAGQAATMTASDALADSVVYFAYSVLGGGSTPVVLLDIELDLRNPLLAGIDRADGAGVATLSRPVPGGTAGATVWLQAAQYGTKSPVVQRVIMN